MDDRLRTTVSTQVLFVAVGTGDDGQLTQYLYTIFYSAFHIRLVTDPTTSETGYVRVLSVSHFILVVMDHT
jgi:hypothetical protein